MTIEQLTALIDSHATTLQLLARSYCVDAPDVVQEAFSKLAALRVWPDDPVAWLYRVVRNRAIDVGRSEKRRHRRENRAARPEAWFCESQVEGIEAAEAVAALEALPEVEREVIIARLWGELTLEQIASVQGCALSTVHRRYEAGIAALQERFGVLWPTKSQ